MVDTDKWLALILQYQTKNAIFLKKVKKSVDMVFFVWYIKCAFREKSGQNSTKC